MLLTSQIFSTILFGPNTDDEATESQACPTISQLSILFNSEKKGKSLKGAPLYTLHSISSKGTSKEQCLLQENLVRLKITLPFEFVNSLKRSVLAKFTP